MSKTRCRNCGVLLGGVRVFRSGFPGEPFCPECGGDDDDSSPDFRLEEGRPEKDWSPNQMRAIENIIRRAGMTGFRLDIEDSAPEVVFRGSLSDVEFRVRVSRDPGAEPLLPWMVEAFNDGERWRQEMEAVGSVVAHAYVEAMAGGLGGSGPPGGQEDRAPSAVDRAAQLRFVADVLSAAAIDGLEMGEPVFRGRDQPRCSFELSGSGVEVVIGLRHEASPTYTKRKLAACWNNSRAVKAAAEAGSSVPMAAVAAIGNGLEGI